MRGETILALSAYGLWCFGAIAEGSDLGMIVQKFATLLIGLAGYLVKSGIANMQQEIKKQGERLRRVEMNVVRVAARRSIQLPHHEDDESNDE
jgi:hypothetical protein